MRLDARADTNFSLWHTAVFSNDGTKVVFTDEWGGGTSPMCQATSMMEMGGNTIAHHRRDDKKYTQHAYFKIPTAQTAQENCVSHNGGLIPVPGRDIMVQGWYQGGVDVMDFTDPDHPFEIGVLRPRLDRSAAGADVPQPRRRAPAGRGGGNTIGGSWGAYYWNGLDLLVGARPRLRHPRAAAERHSCRRTRSRRRSWCASTQYNPQSQPKIDVAGGVPGRAVVSRSAGAEQRARERSARRRSRNALDAAEKQSGAARCNGAERAGEAGGQGCDRREGRCARALDGRRDPASRGGVEVSRRPSHERQRAP